MAGTEALLGEIRKYLGRVERAAAELLRIQDSIPLPRSEELEAVLSGATPLSEEAYILAVLQYAVLRLEEGTLNVRVDLQKKIRTNPTSRDSADLRALLGAVAAREAPCRERSAGSTIVRFSSATKL